VSDGGRVVAGMIGIARRWVERDGLDPDLIPHLSRFLAEMRENELDLDIAAAIKAVDEYDEQLRQAT
jgi:hypothetical protein